MASDGPRSLYPVAGDPGEDDRRWDAGHKIAQDLDLETPTLAPIKQCSTESFHDTPRIPADHVDEPLPSLALHVQALA